MKPWWACMVGTLWVMGAARAIEPPSPDSAKVSPEQLQKLVTQLGDTKFTVRKHASEELSRLGRAALKVLREAGANHKDPEVRKRAGSLVEEIQEQDRPRAALQTILSRLQQAKPPPSDRQVAAAMYLLSLSRPATDAEIDAIENRLKGAKDRADKAEELMWFLLTGREFNEKLAEIALNVMNLKQSIGGPNLAETVAKLNGAEFSKSLAEVSRKLNVALDKMSDAQVVDTLYLVTLARFPSAQETPHVLRHIKNSNAREKILQDLLWAMTNSKEFLLGN